MRLPGTFERPVPGSDAFWDFHIHYSHWLNFVGGSILAAEALFTPKSVGTVGTVHRASLTVRSLNGTENVPIPDIEVVQGKWNTLVQELPRQVYYAAFVQLATGFEGFLGMLVVDVLQRNPDLLAVDEPQLTTREVLAFSNLDEIRAELIRRRRLHFVMRSYPDQMAWFQRHLHVGMHSHKAPLSLDEIHDFFEVRHVIVHSGGHASRECLDRTKHMGVRRSATEYRSPKVDFLELTEFAAKLLAQAEFIDMEVAAKWRTIRNSS